MTTLRSWIGGLLCAARGHRLDYLLQLSPGAPRSEICWCHRRWGRTWDEHGTLVRDRRAELELPAAASRSIRQALVAGAVAAFVVGLALGLASVPPAIVAVAGAAVGVVVLHVAMRGHW